jgi:hypothetical protein
MQSAPRASLEGMSGISPQFSLAAGSEVPGASRGGELIRGQDWLSGDSFRCIYRSLTTLPVQERFLLGPVATTRRLRHATKRENFVEQD